MTCNIPFQTGMENQLPVILSQALRGVRARLFLYSEIRFVDLEILLRGWKGIHDPPPGPGWDDQDRRRTPSPRKSESFSVSKK